MRHLTYIVPVALLSLVTACGSSSTPTATPTTAAPETTSSPTSPSSGSTSSSPDDKGGAAAGQVLTGELAPKDGFKIFLKDSSGALVTTLKAGTYQVKIEDTSAIHNLHLTGPGGVDLKTTVPEKIETTWPVTLVAGEYTFVCDPHPKLMTQKFTVT